MKTDKTDLLVLDLLKENSKLSVREIASRLRKPITTVHNRIKKLNKEEIIKKYTIVPDSKKLGKFVDAFIFITVEYISLKEKQKSQEDIAIEIKKLPGVEEVCLITGANDITVRVKQDNIDKLNDFLINNLRKISGVEKTQTMIVLKSF